MALFTPQTESIIEGIDGANTTRTAISTHIVIRVGNNPVGAIQKMDFREERTIKMIDEVGYDGHIDSVPTSATNVSGSCSRIRFDRLRIAEAFSRGFLHVKSQRVPFDIDVFDKWGGNDGNMIITTVKNVWIKSIGYSYGADNYLITEDMSWEAEDISSYLKGGTASAARLGFGRLKELYTDTAGVERDTDRGLRRGALDVPGLVNATLGSLSSL